MKTHTGLTARFNQPSQEQVMKTRSESVRQDRISAFRVLVAVMLAGASLFGHASPAHAAGAPVAPFGVPCDSVGVSGIPYVPGVNCRFITVDGYRRHFIVYD
jgi:hypothetical protein